MKNNNITSTQKNKLVGVALMSNPTAPKHQTKPTSKVPTSNFQPPTSSTAITLVALVITIIVLLILAGVALTMVLGENGIFDKANEAKEKTNIANTKEQIQMEIANKQAKNEGELTDVELKEILEKYGTINYEEDGKTIKGITTNEEKYEMSIKEIYNGKTTTEDRELATKTITAENYGDEVNYRANGVDSWKVFLNDGENVYIIASECVPRSGMALDTGISAGDGEYCIKGDSRDRLVDWLKETTNWTNYIEKINGAIATGEPTLEQFWESYNNKYKTNYSAESQDLSKEEGYNDTFYFPHKDEWNNWKCYWLTTPCSTLSDCIENVHAFGLMDWSGYKALKVGVRPLICLPSNIYGTNSEGKWTFTK